MAAVAVVVALVLFAAAARFDKLPFGVVDELTAEFLKVREPKPFD